MAMNPPIFLCLAIIFGYKGTKKLLVGNFIYSIIEIQFSEKKKNEIAIKNLHNSKY